jgi:SOS response regulatory protein OraA/RecX
MNATQRRDRLPNRRRSETFNIECSGLAYTATASWFDDSRLAELFLNNHKSNSAADVRDAAIALSLALQNGADVEVIRKALCCESHGRASGPLGAALDRLVTG